MVDVSEKPVVPRTARASGRILLSAGTLARVREGRIVKGDVLATARVAAVLAVKDTPRIVPLCHPLPIERVDVDWDLDESSISCTVTVKSRARTGVEMEALAGVTAGLLAVWDMTKAYEKDEGGQYPSTRITDIRVEDKKKGDARE
ncbi:MAG: cyclic pyranopterin monophosphate synthase MoaC [Candidatus Undinarchaeales archaeon]|nr:cyclic pyranopterin monophosphate synthase MoaC [Candidatus Undinarchaeales archaeon]MDP7491762.1 cyclic pyranopterin monophosphate synthase MoaC [Candidatus Undinarchaeales archaeon]